MVFLDTNVLLYAGSIAREDTTKQRVSADLIRSLEFAISAQVVQEFIANALRKKDLGFTENSILATLRTFEEITVLPVTRDLILRAWFIRQRHQLSHWDATILAAAEEMDCHTLYSEDFNHGQAYGSVRVLNPYLSL